MDAAQAALKSEQEARLPFIVPEEFWVDYEPQPDGSQKPVEWVRWVKKGMQNPATCVEKVSRISKVKDGNVAPEWMVLKPYYEKWKAGEDAPINGTPLLAWPGATPQLVKALAPANIRSIEDLAEMEDSAIQRLAVPKLREYQKNARAYLEIQKTTFAVSGEVAKLRDDLEHQRRENAELRALIEQYAIKKEQDDPAPKRRGRPPKTEAA